MGCRNTAVPPRGAPEIFRGERRDLSRRQPICPRVKNPFSAPTVNRARTGRSKSAEGETMYPLKSILVLLLADIAQLPPGDRGEALCATFARFLPQLSEPELKSVRAEVSRYWH